MIDYNQWLSQDTGLRTVHRAVNEERAARLYAGLAPLRRVVAGASDALRRGWQLVEGYRRRQATRRELARLNDHLLADIGIERSDIARFSLDTATARPQKVVRRPGKIDIRSSGNVIVLRPRRRQTDESVRSVPICPPRPAA